MNRHRATCIVTSCLLGCCVLGAIFAAGCQSNSHSQGLLEEKKAGGVNDPYIVRDAGKPQPKAPSTQAAEQPPGN